MKIQMTQNDFPLVGGEYDGLRWSGNGIHPPPPQIWMVHDAKFRRITDYTPVPDEIPMKRERYVLEQFQVEGHKLYFYREEHLALWEAVVMLFQYYRTEKTK